MVIVWDLSFNYWFRVGKESNHYFTDLKINLHGIHYLQWDPHVEPAKLVLSERRPKVNLLIHKKNTYLANG